MNWFHTEEQRLRALIAKLERELAALRERLRSHKPHQYPRSSGGSVKVK